MRSGLAKHLHPLLGRRMVDWVVAAATPLAPDPLVIVASPETAGAFDGLVVAVQERPLGTGDAVRSAREALGDADAVLVLSGDTPLITTECLTELVRAHGEARAAVTVLSFVPEDPRSYGRIVRGDDGEVVAIVEAVDATPEQLGIDEVNSSIYVFRGDALWSALGELTAHNAQGELYLTDAVRAIAREGATVAAYVAPDPTETEGVNTRVELAAATAALRDRVNEAHMGDATGPADDVHPVEPAAVEKRDDVGCTVGHRAALDPRGARVAGPRVGQEPTAPGERRVDEWREGDSRGRGAEMEQDAWRAPGAGLPALEPASAGTVDREGLLGHSASVPSGLS